MIKGLSLVWKYFKKSTDKKLATCLICQKEYRTSGNTSNLRDHLKRMHPNMENENDRCSSGSSSILSSMRSIDSHFKRGAEYDPTSSRKKEIDKALARLIGVDLQPFSIVNHEGFRSYTKILDPRYVLPSKTTLKNVHIQNMYEQCRSKLRDLLSAVEYLAITTDCWTSAATESYITVTCQFIDPDFSMRTAVLSTMPLLEATNHNADNIAKSLHDIFINYDILDKVTYIVTDNASNITKACEILKKKNLPCLAHTLNLVVQNSLLQDKDNIHLAPLLQKCKTIVTFFKKSSNATELFKKAQNTETPLKLIQEVATRWNSSYMMIKRILETIDAISSVLMANRKAPEPFTEEEMVTLKQVEKILSLFYTLTVRCSGNGLTISLIIPLVNGLYRNLCEMETKIEGVVERLFPYEKRTATKISTLLDPRFKKKAFISILNANSAAMLLESEMNCIAPSVSERPIENISQPGGDPLFQFLEDARNEEVTSRKVDNIITKRQYLERPNLIQSANILDFWKTSKDDFIPMKTVALKYFCIPATSTESERTFSKCGVVSSERRNRLKPKNVDKIVFLNKNHWLS
ncbi:E3 SUMO-protein ligase ZBED1-like isoform X3 [Eurosta solidaginis]|uniref:E3 SUMO-protein ligase ZBED1-like isoform X3 n=1 Tax=Eurosta solidaginis TaxID=178769 RepID=UPI0035311A84